MNPNARTIPVEVLFNPQELSVLDVIRNGMARSTFLRSLSNAAARTHGKPPPPPRESRGCRGARPANRASVGCVFRPTRV